MPRTIRRSVLAVVAITALTMIRVGAAEPVAAGSDTVVKGEIVGRENEQRVVDAKLTHTARPVRPGQAVTLSIEIDIEEGWHVNSSKPTLKYLIPTSVSFPDSDEGLVIDLAYPPGELVDLEFADDRLSVYEGKTIIRATIRPPPDSPQGIAEFPSRLTYQACSNTRCLAPETREFKVALRIEGEPVEIAAGPANRGGESGGAAGASGEGGLRGGGADLAAVLEESGLLTLLMLVFVGGLALNLTPCVYPMIPVTIGFFSNQASGSWGHRIGLPTLYILGMAVTYSILGLVAGLTGGLFGATLQSPWVVGGLVVLFVAMALWMFGLFEFRMPSAVTRVSGGRRGPVGAVLMGGTVGLVAAPCIGPFVVGLLVFVGASGQPVLGFWLFFVLAIGLGLPSLLLGIFSGTLASLPRSGMWLIYAKKVMGIALLAVAIYFLQPFLSDRQVGWIALAFAGASALYLSILERSRITSSWFLGARLSVGALVAFAGLWLAMPLVSARPELKWGPYTAEGLEAARAEGRPIIIDFFADWCLPCKELDRYTFSDPQVIEAAQRFLRLKADLTSFSSEPVAELRDRFDVVGVPTIVFIDGRGDERVDLRLYGFEEPQDFVERLAQVE
jgi:thiol:disulfide interchange protein DsbD